MKLEKFKKNRKLKRSFVVVILVVTLGIGGIGIFKTFAWYQVEKDYNVINGEVPDFGYDVKLAIMVDGAKQTDMPASPVGKDGKYYDVDVSCTSSKTQGLWDYNAWRLNLDYIESNSKCTLTFTSSMTKDQYDEYIKSGVALRRSTYRGKNITGYYNGTELVNGKNLFKQISDGTFDDIYVGDYIVSNTKDKWNKNIVWIIADLDNYWNQGDQALTKHHATIIPSYMLEQDRMNETNSTLAGAGGLEGVGGYKGSEMYQTTLNNIYTQYIAPDFCKVEASTDCHIITYRNLVSTNVDANRSNQWGQNNGASSAWEWDDRKLDLMSEVNVYGTTVWSSSGYDIGLDNRQYAIFALRPELINQSITGISGASTGRYWYWLKAVAHSADFASVNGYGVANTYYASDSNGVRPRFLID